jgi:hypothetical protein
MVAAGLRAGRLVLIEYPTERQEIGTRKSCVQRLSIIYFQRSYDAADPSFRGQLSCFIYLTSIGRF